MRKTTAALGAVLAIIFFAADRAAKVWVVANMELGDTLPLLPGFVELLRLHNYGAAWSSFSGMRWVLIGVTGVIIIGLIVLLFRGVIRHPMGVFGVALIISGGLGNLIDRATLGYVVDMFHFQFWPSYPVFNVADIAVVAGGIMAVVYYLFIYDRHDKRVK